MDNLKRGILYLASIGAKYHAYRFKITYIETQTLETIRPRRSRAFVVTWWFGARA